MNLPLIVIVKYKIKLVRQEGRKPCMYHCVISELIKGRGMNPILHSYAYPYGQLNSGVIIFLKLH